MKNEFCFDNYFFPFFLVNVVPKGVFIMFFLEVGIVKFSLWSMVCLGRFWAFLWAEGIRGKLWMREMENQFWKMVGTRSCMF